MAKGKVTAKKSAKKPANKAAKKPEKKTAPKAAAQSVKKTAKKAATKPAKASAKKTSGAKASSSKAKSSVKTSAKASSKSTAKKPVLKVPLMSKPPTFSSGKKADAVKSATKSSPKTAKSTEKLDLSDFITPLDDRVIIQPQERETMTAGGLYIPDNATNDSSNLEGWVVSVGRGHLSPKGHVRPMDVKVGDRVLFPKHAGSQFKVQNHDLLILRETDVLGVVG